MGLAGRFQDKENTSISFPGWKEALERSGLSAVVRESHAREVARFLHHCKTLHAPATIALAKSYLSRFVPSVPTTTRDALRWFVVTAFKGARGGSMVLSGLDRSEKRESRGPV